MNMLHVLKDAHVDHEKFVARMGLLLEKARSEGRDLTDSERKDFDGLSRKAEREKAIIDAAKAMQLEQNKPRAASTEPLRLGRLARDGGPLMLRGEERLSDHVEADLPDRASASDFCLGRLCRGMLLGDWRGSEIEVRATGGASGGGAVLIPHPVSAMFVDLARARSVCVAAGAMTIPIDGTTIKFPRLTGDVTAAWRAEHADISESDPTIDGVDATPKSVAAMVRVSNELLADAPDLAGRMLNRTLTQALAVEIDRAALRGDGTGSTPTGIRSTSGVTLTDLNGAVLTFDHLADGVGVVRQLKEEPNAIVMAPKYAALLDKQKASTSGVWMGYSGDVAAIPRFVTAQVPVNLGVGTNESEVYIGDFSQLALVVRQQIQIEATRYAGTAFGKNQSLIRAIARVDAMVMRSAAFNVLTEVRVS